MLGETLEATREASATARANGEDEKGAHPRAVPCRNHAFDESLMCRCGTSWWAHQLEPHPCPHDARGRNRHSVTVASKRPEARGH